MRYLYKSLKYLLDAKNIYENHNDIKNSKLCLIYNNIAKIYEESGLFHYGIYFYELAVQWGRNLQNKEDLAISLGNLGVSYGTYGEIDMANINLSECISIYKSINLEQTYCASLFNRYYNKLLYNPYSNVV